MSLSAALEEAYASGDEAITVQTTLQIDHPALYAPIFWVTGIDGPSGDETAVIMLPIIEGGSPVAHTP